jgi:hypothetical protein
MNTRKMRIAMMAFACFATFVGEPLALIGPASAQSNSARSRQCSEQAESYANRNTRRTTAAGAVTGAAVGGVARGNRSSMGRGALIGGGAGLVHGSSRWQTYYNRGYNACMGR